MIVVQGEMTPAEEARLLEGQEKGDVFVHQRHKVREREKEREMHRKRHTERGREKQMERARDREIER